MSEEAKLADHVMEFAVLGPREQRRHLTDAHGVRMPVDYPNQHRIVHRELSMAEAHGVESPGSTLDSLRDQQVARNIERVRRFGLNGVVMDDVSLIARVCLGVLDYTTDYAKLHGALPPRLERMRFEAQQLHGTLKRAASADHNDEDGRDG